VLHTCLHPNITLFGSKIGRNLRYWRAIKNNVILQFVSPSVTNFSNRFMQYSCSFLRAFGNWYSNAVEFKFIAHKLMSVLERTSGVRTSRHRKEEHCLWRLCVLNACPPKVTQEHNSLIQYGLIWTVSHLRPNYVVSLFQRSLLSELGGWTKALSLPGEVNCIREPVSGPTTIKPDWAKGCCEGRSEVIGLRLGWCCGENALVVKTFCPGYRSVAEVGRCF
jgi:hypothetical protein